MALTRNSTAAISMTVMPADPVGEPAGGHRRRRRAPSRAEATAKPSAGGADAEVALGSADTAPLMTALSKPNRNPPSAATEAMETTRRSIHLRPRRRRRRWPPAGQSLNAARSWWSFPRAAGCAQVSLLTDVAERTPRTLGAGPADRLQDGPHAGTRHGGARRPGETGRRGAAPARPRAETGERRSGVDLATGEGLPRRWPSADADRPLRDPAAAGRGSVDVGGHPAPGGRGRQGGWRRPTSCTSRSSAATRTRIPVLPGEGGGRGGPRRERRARDRGPRHQFHSLAAAVAGARPSGPVGARPRATWPSSRWTPPGWPPGWSDVATGPAARRLRPRHRPRRPRAADHGARSPGR